MLMRLGVSRRFFRFNTVLNLMAAFGLMSVSQWVHTQPEKSIFDVDGSQKIDAGDLLYLIDGFSNETSSPDFDGNQQLNAKDLYRFAQNWKNSVETDTIVPPINDPSVGYDLYASTVFLYDSSQPIQIGMEPDAIDSLRVAIVRGQVLTQEREPIPGVTVTVSDYTEYGSTQTRADGNYDMAVNGGSKLTLRYRKAGYLPIDRVVTAPWRDYTIVDEVVMTPLDDKVTLVDLIQPTEMQVAEGTPVTDEDGSRQARLLVPVGTQATAVSVNGQSVPLTELHVRATEFTVGPDGPDAMPAKLPPNSGYTYCVEFSVDEVSDLDDQTVQFNRPLYLYVENFLNFPVGGIVPVGYYDRQLKAWLPSENGIVIELVGIDGNGFALLDVNGSGGASSANQLAALDITDAERKKLAELYKPGQSLWRAPITHFTPWDCNWPYGPPDDADPPTTPPPDEEEEEDPCKEQGSIIQIQNQILGESLDLVGIPFQLNYSSGRVRGRTLEYHIDIPLSGDSVPSSLKQIDLQISIAGQRLERSFPPQPNQSYTYTWDGKDVYGRPVQGSQPVTVRTGYVYQAVYMEPSSFEQSFARYSGVPIEGSQARQEVTLWKDWIGSIGTWDARGIGLGGWFLSDHHSYDPAGRILYKGDGSKQRVNAQRRVIATVAGSGPVNWDEEDPFNNNFNELFGDNIAANKVFLISPYGVAVGEDGSLYIAETMASRIRKVSRDGIITTLAGQFTGIPGGSLGDGGPATQARLNMPFSVALGPDGSLYIADSMNHRIRRIAPNGMIQTVAGNGIGFDFSNEDVGDNGPATQASLIMPSALAVGEDGGLYIADLGHNRIRYVNPQGIITTIAGNPDSDRTEDGIPAIEARIDEPWGVAVGPDGSVFFTDGVSRVRKIGPDGIIQTVAGMEESGYGGDGGPASLARLDGPNGLAIGPDGALYIADKGNSRIRRVNPEGIIDTVVGNGAAGYGGDGGSATEAQLNNPQYAAMGPDGNLYIADSENGSIRKVSPALPGYSLGHLAIADETGSRLYVFNSQGRHLETKDLLAGTLLYRFGYDDEGRFSYVEDAYNRRTSIERDANGNASVLIGPGGQRSTLTIDTTGYLQSIRNPAGENTTLTYHTDGLLATLTKPENHQWIFAYDTSGRLTLDQDPAGGFTALERVEKPNGFEVTLTTALGDRTVYGYEELSSGEVKKTIVSPGGQTTETVLKLDGTEVTRMPDGTEIRRSGAMENCPCLDAGQQETVTVTTPAGLSSTLVSERTIRLATANDASSLVSIGDLRTVNARVYNTSYEIETKQIVKTSPEGRQQILTLNDKGLVEQVIKDAALSPLLFLYNEQGLLLSKSKGEENVKQTYDAKGRMLSETDAAGNVTEYEYDDADRITKITKPSGRAYQYRYDQNGNVTKMIMPNGAEHTFTFTSVDIEKTYTDPLQGVLQLEQDKQKRLTKITLPSGREITSEYDASGRKTYERYPEAYLRYDYEGMEERPYKIAWFPKDSSGGRVPQSVAFEYDGGLIAKMSWAGNANGVYTYRYDNNFFLQGVKFDNEPETVIQRDKDGLAVQYGPFAISRNGPLGNPDSIQDGRMNIQYEYDTNGRVSRRVHTVKDAVIYDLKLIYDKTGRLTESIETIEDVPHTFLYTYDPDGFLTEVKRDGVVTEQYAYDVNGNRTSRKHNNAAEDAFLYDMGDRIVDPQGIDRSYKDGFTDNVHPDAFTYTANGELLYANLGLLGPSSQTVVYSYDYEGRRVYRWVETKIEQYFYGDLNSPNRLTASRDANGILSAYTYDDDGHLFALERGGTRYYVATDVVGTPRVVCDSEGTVIQIFHADSFGHSQDSSSPAFDLPVGFAGGLRDTATGWVKFGARDYDPEIGRWTARDPLLYEGSEFNLYTYADNDPINWYDPTGTQKAPKVPQGYDEYKKFNDEAKKRAKDSVKPYCKGTKSLWEQVIDVLKGGNGKQSGSSTSSSSRGGR